VTQTAQPKGHHVTKATLAFLIVFPAVVLGLAAFWLGWSYTPDERVVTRWTDTDYAITCWATSTSLTCLPESALVSRAALETPAPTPAPLYLGATPLTLQVGDQTIQAQRYVELPDCIYVTQGMWAAVGMEPEPQVYTCTQGGWRLVVDAAQFIVRETP